MQPFHCHARLAVRVIGTASFLSQWVVIAAQSVLVQAIPETISLLLLLHLHHHLLGRITLHHRVRNRMAVVVGKNLVVLLAVEGCHLLDGLGGARLVEVDVGNHRVVLGPGLPRRRATWNLHVGQDEVLPDLLTLSALRTEVFLILVVLYFC